MCIRDSLKGRLVINVGRGKYRYTMISRKKMESLLRSSDPELFYYPIKEGATLDEDFEDVQTVDDFLCSLDRDKVTSARHTFHVYFIGEIPAKLKKLAERLFKFLAAFFSMSVVVKGSLSVDFEKGKFARISSSKKENCAKVQRRKRGAERMALYPEKVKGVAEINSDDLLMILRQYVEKDTFTVLGITACNIYNPYQPDDVIMGFSCRSRSSVVSIVECFNTRIKSQAQKDKIAFFELVKTTAHELSHTMGIDHCVEFHCMMNSLYVKEAETSPIYFCPTCLCKLQAAVNFDCKKRWEALRSFYTNNGMKEAAKWVSRRLKQWNKDYSKHS
eukprot:TRINITY_DN2379_c0_g6_i1.p1 TRINITY_DN2379_c0_g6~~TRINITY_DN2379_c0_g6_i1.p1  ORF type:complete len:332 (-),score=81.15 TRINITY_DN2379_c0_g6_i1:118-1113(-)